MLDSSSVSCKGASSVSEPESSSSEVSEVGFGRGTMVALSRPGAWSVGREEKT